MTVAKSGWRALSAPRNAPATLVGLLALVFLFLFLRNAGIYPVIFVDEWIYSSATRMTPLSEAQVPSYLYFQFYKLTNYCGDSYLDCNRFFNGAWFVLAAPFVYLLARRVAPAWPAVLIALAVSLSPASAYTPFFMPEAMYFFAFWCYSWAAFVFFDRPGARAAILLGALLGLAVLVKLHALFLLPASALFALYTAYARRPAGGGWRWLRPGLLWAALTVAAAVLVRLGLGYLLAGKNGLALMGSLYAGQAAYTAKSHYPIGQLIVFAWHNLQGHLMLLALLFGVPLAALVASLRHLRPGDEAGRRLQAFSVYTLLMLGSVVAVTIMFTASITGLAVSDSTARIHTRYYEFALPLLLLCGAAAWQAPAPTLKRAARIAIGLLVLVLVWHARTNLLRYFDPLMLDTPELRTLSMRRGIFNTVTALAVLTLLAWMRNQRLGLRLFFLLMLPVITLCQAWGTAHEVRLSRWADPASKAGLFARHYLDRGQSNQLVLVADDIAVLHRMRFFIENPNTAFLQATPGQPVDWSQLPAGRQWVLVVGGYAPPPDARIIARKNDMLLFQPPALNPLNHRLDLTQPIAEYGNIDGVGGAETWGGVWSLGRKVELSFGHALPKHFTLRVEGRAFGPNIGLDLPVTVDEQRKTMRLGAHSSTVELEFDTDGKAHTILFAVPQPTSQKQLGLAEDTRPFGIGLEHLTILP